MQVFQEPIELSSASFRAVNVFVTDAEEDGERVLRVVKDPSVQKVDEPTYAKVQLTDFANGTIEVEVKSRLLPDAPGFARGFIGVAFHADPVDTRFECFYLRPANSTCDDMVRRNHTVQYFSYPDHKFDRLRELFPKKFETYAEIDLDEWITMLIEVDGPRATLTINGAKRAVLVVPERLNAGMDSGGIGLWVDVGTEGYFRRLRVTRKP